MTVPSDDLVKALDLLHVEELPGHTFVDSTSLASILDGLFDLPVTLPSIYIDFDGVRLSRYGTISIIQIYILPQDHTYLVDIHHLHDLAFSIAGRRKDHTLKTVLESRHILRVIFDVRIDSDALYHLFGIKLAAVRDLQLMEFPTRPRRGGFLNGLSKCID